MSFPNLASRRHKMQSCAVARGVGVQLTLTLVGSRSRSPRVRVRQVTVVGFHGAFPRATRTGTITRNDFAVNGCAGETNVVSAADHLLRPCNTALNDAESNTSFALRMACSMSVCFQRRRRLRTATEPDPASKTGQPLVRVPDGRSPVSGRKRTYVGRSQVSESGALAQTCSVGASTSS